MKRLLLFVPIILFACVMSPPATEEDFTHIYDASYDDVFEAVKITLFDLGAEIVAGSRDSGFLNARVKLPSEFITTFLLDDTKLIYINYHIMFNPGTIVRLKIFTAYADGGYPHAADRDAYLIFWQSIGNNLTT